MTILTVAVFIIVGLLLIACIGAWITRNVVYTPPFLDADGKPLPNSIAEFRRIKLGGYSQAVLIRGKSLNNPVLLFLHAGPALSETGMMRNMNAVLEKHYTMVYLDQRGGAKSYSPFMDYQTMNTEQLIQDIHELTQYLKERFGKEKIAIMGHSFGAGFGALAAARYPEDYAAFIGLGQPVNPIENDRLTYQVVLEKAKAEGNTQAVKDLEGIDGYWLSNEKDTFFSGMMVLKNKWIPYYGGQIYGEKGFMPFVIRNSLCSEFTVFDYVPYFLGMTQSGPASWNIMTTTDLKKQAAHFECPFIILQGRQDINVSSALLEEYYQMVDAPVKRLYWFEQSAHFPHLEESERFQSIMIEEILPVIKEVKQ